MVTTEALTENSRQGINSKIPPCTGPEACLSPNLRPGCGHAYDETSVDLVVYVRNDPVNYIDPDGKEPRSPWEWYCNDETCWVHVFWDFYRSGRSKQGTGKGGSSKQLPYYDRFPCDERDSTNKLYFDFIRSHRAEAAQLAGQLGVETSWVLAVSSYETTQGTSNIARVAHNFFGLHAPEPEEPFPPGEIRGDKYHALKDGYVWVFPEATGFMDSGQMFVNNQLKNVEGMTSAVDFAKALHSHGYGVGNKAYVDTLLGQIDKVNVRLQCPQLKSDENED